ncbi:MAG: methyltransferase, partial [Thermoplasmata archaeon]|nr:methyltransferase [Thermoplasmata archaeon]
KVHKGEDILEIGTGCGLIALHCAMTANVTATDVNPHAIELAKKNALSNGLKLEVIKSDLFENIGGKFDVIIFNPPYLEGKDNVGRKGEWLDRAWDGGQGGDEVVLRFLSRAGDFLKPRGRVYLLLSSKNKGAMDIISEKFKAKMLGLKKLFFEKLAVYELAL